MPTTLTETLALEAVSLARAIVAAPRRYSDPVEQMLASVIDSGSTLLLSLAKPAVTRLLAHQRHADRLFSADELRELASEIAAAQATAHLLGRSLVADHAERVQRRRVRESKDASGHEHDSGTGQFTSGGGGSGGGKQKDWGAASLGDKKAAIHQHAKAAGHTAGDVASDPAKLDAVHASIAREFGSSVSKQSLQIYADVAHQTANPDSAKLLPPLRSATTRQQPNPDLAAVKDSAIPSDLSHGEKVAQQVYSFGGDGPMNGALRQGGKVPEEYAAVHERLQSAFGKVKTFDKPVPVVRAMDLPPEHLASFLHAALASHGSGEPVQLAGYTSTATGNKIGAAFKGNVELHINAVHGLDMMPVSHFPHERELLLNHDSQFRVTKVEKTSKGKYKVHMDQVPPGSQSKQAVTQGQHAGKAMPDVPKEKLSFLGKIKAAVGLGESRGDTERRRDARGEVYRQGRESLASRASRARSLVEAEDNRRTGRPDSAGRRRVSALHTILEGEGIQALAPDDALAFFRSLIPTLGTDPLFLPSLQRSAFTLAVAVEHELLKAVQGVIADRLKNGEVSTGPAAVQSILDAAGVSPRNSDYASMVFRTNSMDAYNSGLFKQQQEEAETFPVWRYSNPDDSRSRPKHAALNGNYYPANVSIDAVRGDSIAEKANCRCTPVPIEKWEWSELRARGARIAPGYVDVL